MRLLICEPVRNLGEQAIVRSFVKGLIRHNVPYTMVQKDKVTENLIDPSVIVVTGRLASCAQILSYCRRKDADFIYFDKGYLRRGWGTENPEGYIRFVVNALHASDYFQEFPRPSDRWRKLKVQLSPPKKKGQNIIFAGCTEKFATFHNFNAVDYAKSVVDAIHKIINLPIIYRPKPGGRNTLGYNPVTNTTLSGNDRTIDQELKNAYALVTFSSNAAIDALIAGVPAFVLGPGMAKPVSNTDLAMLKNPYFPSEKERNQFFYDLAYCQWNGREIEKGVVWEDLKNILQRIKKKILRS
ncbi:MAG: hypothetical protein HYZ87_00055 [Candidatus Omnitrophica bacterium]|nr:hypothetical protein [Candidatus Omnitrophota bacterium]